MSGRIRREWSVPNPASLVARNALDQCREMEEIMSELLLIWCLLASLLRERMEYVRVTSRHLTAATDGSRAVH